MEVTGMHWRAYARENKFIVLLEPDPSPRMGLGLARETSITYSYKKGSWTLSPPIQYT